jgi:hypothetical protein
MHATLRAVRCRHILILFSKAQLGKWTIHRLIYEASAPLQSGRKHKWLQIVAKHDAVQGNRSMQGQPRGSCAHLRISRFTFNVEFQVVGDLTAAAGRWGEPVNRYPLGGVKLVVSSIARTGQYKHALSAQHTHCQIYGLAIARCR